MRTRSARLAAVPWLLRASRAAFALAFLLAMATPEWERGTFSLVPLWRFRLSGEDFQVGVLALLPVVSGATWIAARLLGRSRSWRWGPLHVALPVLGFAALALTRAWPVHIRHHAVVTGIAVALFAGVYLYALQELPGRWVAGLLALLLLLQGGTAILQFARQDSVGLSWMGEGTLDPNGQGVSVIEAGGRRWLRAYGLTAHPNVLGGYLSMGVLVCLGALAAWPARRRPWIYGAIGIGAVGLFLSFSRSAWLGTGAALLTMALLVRPWQRVDWRSPRNRRVLLLGGGALVALLLILAVLFGDLLTARLFRLGDPLESTSIQERLVDIRQAWDLFLDVPLKGAGSGYYIDALWAGVGEERPPGFRKVHNAYLLAAAELGVGGVILWLWMLLGPPLALFVARRPAVSAWQRSGWAAAFVSAAVVCVFDSYLYIPSTWWPALFLGLLCGAWARVEGDEGVPEARA